MSLHKLVCIAGLGCLVLVTACRHSTSPPLSSPPPHPHRPERDPLPDVKDAKLAVAQALGRMAAAQPGRVPQLVAAALSPEQQQALAGYCQAAGVTIA